jgi:hypothetical protein
MCSIALGVIMYIYTVEIRKIKGKSQVCRIWYNDWFPINPVTGVDIKSREKSVLDARVGLPRINTRCDSQKLFPN